MFRVTDQILVDQETDYLFFFRVRCYLSAPELTKQVRMVLLKHHSCDVLPHGVVLVFGGFMTNLSLFMSLIFDLRLTAPISD